MNPNNPNPHPINKILLVDMDTDRPGSHIMIQQVGITAEVNRRPPDMDFDIRDCLQILSNALGSTILLAEAQGLYAKGEAIQIAVTHLSDIYVDIKMQPFLRGEAYKPGDSVAEQKNTMAPTNQNALSEGQPEEKPKMQQDPSENIGASKSAPFAHEVLPVATVGRIVHYYHNGKDAVAGSNGAVFIPAMVVQGWGNLVANIVAFPVNVDVQTILRYSVSHKSQAAKDNNGNVISTYWEWPPRN